jgi:hypothetical protein
MSNSTINIRASFSGTLPSSQNLYDDFAVNIFTFVYELLSSKGRTLLEKQLDEAKWIRSRSKSSASGGNNSSTNDTTISSPTTNSPAANFMLQACMSEDFQSVASQTLSTLFVDILQQLVNPVTITSASASVENT